MTIRASPPVPTRIATGYKKLVIPSTKGNTPAEIAGITGERRSRITSKQIARSNISAVGP